MADEFRRLAQVTLTASYGLVYTAPSETSVLVRHIRVVNTSAGSVSVGLRQAGSATGNSIMPAAAITAGGWAEFDGVIILNPSEALYGIAGVASVVIVTVYGLVVG